MRVSVLRPGLLVSLKSSIRGNVRYATRDIEEEHLTEDGTKLAVWETERTIEDPAEHELAVKVRSKARSMITAVCSHSSFGLLCPEADSDKLSSAIEDAQEMVNQFNRTSRLSRVAVYVIAGRIAPDDVEAVRAINSEVRDLLADMEQGLRNLDVKAVRDAADKAKGIGAMLSADAQARIQSAIDAARSCARKIVKAGEVGALEIDQATLRKLASARTEFLDLDEEEVEIAAPVETARAIDLAPADVLPVKQTSAAPTMARLFELD